MRFATYNVEWFANLFDADNRLYDDEASSGRHDVTRAAQTAALGRVFRALDADAIMVIEAPNHGRRQSTVAALMHFAAHFGLRAREAVMGFSNDTQQEIALLYDPSLLTARHAPQATAEAPRFDQTLRIDLDVDATEDAVVFSKPPLELEVVTQSGFALQMIGAHLKSKAPHGAKSDADVLRLAIANRRKQLAQAIWLRRRIDALIAAGRPVMVMGDMNDGPGLDEFEDLFGRSSVEIVLGAGEAALFDPHAKQALSRRLGAAPTSARFWITPEQRYLQALLDYIMVTPELRARAARWRIWHPMDDPDCWADPALRDALLTASDHFPVTLDIEL
ncbi:endonuclease/exonuclease/phosphatase family protein [Sulfitobacter sp. PS-8MA]|uniref:endonuclease/exonuclease/phosphatase family protein n=1 Tax=Sulfitobacter sp. PS-8MA TaxID=3237707 RepID=UPI0034C5C601